MSRSSCSRPDPSSIPAVALVFASFAVFAAPAPSAAARPPAPQAAAESAPSAAAPSAAEPAPSAARAELLRRDEEIAAALEAGPASIADGAGVWVLEAAGYVQARPSENGFHCLVGRSVPGSFEPQCFDEEGSATILKEVLLAAELRAGGLGPEEVERGVAAAYAAGRLRAPSRPGINYMLSERNLVPVDEKGTVRPYRPHVMFYVPYLTNRDLGAGPGSPVFVVGEGTPSAYAIVPVPAETLAHRHSE